MYILNNAITVSVLIIAIIVIRFLLKKLPKWGVCLLWLLVAIKLVLPVHIESALSVIPSGEPIPSNIALENSPQINSGINRIDNIVNPIIQQSFIVNPADSVNPLQIYLSVGMWVWIAGVIIMMLYAAVTYALIKKRVRASVRIEPKVYECDDISDPFILGVLLPKVYVPSGLEKEARGYILKHEFAHISRFDYIWKPLGFAILSVYWFNPLCWIAYILLCKDIEYACDEKATKDIKKEEKAEYCKVLLDYSMSKKMITVCPVAFGETDVKSRVKNLAKNKKTTFLVVILSILIFAFVGVCFATSRRTNASKNCPITDVSNEKMYGMSAAYAPALLMIDPVDARNISDALVSAKWIEQEENVQIPDGEFYSLFVYNGGNPFRMDFYVNGYVIFEQNNITKKYIIEFAEDNLIHNIVNPQDLQTAANGMSTFVPENINTIGVWEADAESRQSDRLEEQIESKEQNETELQSYLDKMTGNAGDVFRNVKYDFGDFYVEPRGYVFDGELLYYMYDIVNGNDTSAVTIRPEQEDAEVTYYVSNGAHGTERSVMWAIIHFNNAYDSCDIEISAEESDDKYHCLLEKNGLTSTE